MAYYRGAGDYYRGSGDPGFFGALARGALNLGRAALGIPAAPRPAVPTSTSISLQPPMLGGIKLGPSLTVEKYSGVSVGLTKDGRARRIRQDGKPWKRPTMNPANPRALRRSLRRIEGFGRLAARASAEVARANRALNRIPRKTAGRKKR